MTVQNRDNNLEKEDEEPAEVTPAVRRVYE
jgi:hypothetical protein